MGSDEASRDADVGLLFVHGIGAQRKGQGINEAGNALLRWFRRAPRIAGFENLGAEIGTVTTWRDEPANAELLLDLPRGAKQRWLLAESHWADVFLPPSIAPTLIWTFKTSPLLLLSRAVESLAYAFAAWSGTPLHWWRILIAVAWLAAVVPVTVLLVVSLTVLILLRSLIPLAGVKDALAKLEVILTAQLGDSFMYSENAISRGAMVSKVRAEIDWLADRADRVVVVAHSQGAAVALAALSAGKAVDTLVTFGAGISQLAWVRSGSENRATSGIRLILLVGWLGLLVVYAVTGYQFARYASGEPLEPLLWAVALVGWAPLAWFTFGLYREILGASRQSRIDDAAPRPSHRWWDIWASADPVSGGPSTSWTHPDVSEFRAFNAGNVLTDHTSYYRNSEDFVARVALAGLVPPAPATRPAYARRLHTWVWRTSTLRIRRGRWLEIWRLGMLAFFAATLWRFTDDARIGLGGILKHAPLPADWATWSRWEPVQIGLAVLSLAVAVGALYLLGTLHWKLWGFVDAESVADVLRGAKPLDRDRLIASRPQLAVLCVGAALPWAAFAAAVGVLIDPSAIVDLIRAGLAALGFGLVLYIATIPVNALLRRVFVRDVESRARISASARHGWLLVVPAWAVVYICVSSIRSPGALLETTQSLTWTELWCVLSTMLALTWLSVGFRISRTAVGSRPPRLLGLVQNPATYQPVKYRTLHTPSNRLWAAGVAAVLALQIVVVLTLPLMSMDARAIAVSFTGLGGFFFGFGAIAAAIDMDSRWGKAVGAVAAGGVIALSIGVFVRALAP